MGRDSGPFRSDLANSMLKDPFQLIPEQGASAFELRAACETLARHLREAQQQRSEAEMALRRLVYRRRRGIELVRDSEVRALEVIAARNATPLRAADGDEDAIVSAEVILHDAVTRAVGLLNQVVQPSGAHQQAHQVLRRALVRVADHAADTDRRDPSRFD